MNIKKTFAFLALTCLVLVGCKDQKTEATEGTTIDTLNTETKPVASNEVVGKLEKATFEIEGMSCAVGCAKVIEGKLAKLDGVKSATVDFETKTAKVEFDNAKQNPNSIQETVEEIAKGAYKVENMSSSLETAMLFDQEPKQEKKSCCASKEGKSCSSDEKKDENKADKKDASTKQATTKDAKKGGKA